MHQRNNCKKLLCKYKENLILYIQIRMQTSHKKILKKQAVETILASINGQQFTMVYNQLQGLFSYIAHETSEDLWKFLREDQCAFLKVLSLNSARMGQQGCQMLSKFRWLTLQELRLENNNIYSNHCHYFSMSQWPSLKTLDLGQNNIDAQGCDYLRRANWPLLSTLLLDNNEISNSGCKFLSEAKWPLLKKLCLLRAEIGPEGCRHLSRGKWPILQIIDLDFNQITSQGCQYLSEGQWPHLSKLFLSANSIDDSGFVYLNKGKCTLRILDLDNNKINLSSFNTLSRLQSYAQFHGHLLSPSISPLHNLVSLRINFNSIQSVQQLCRLSSPILETISLRYNLISSVRPLVKLASKSLKNLYLNHNMIKQLKIDDIDNKLNQLQVYENLLTNTVQSLVKNSFEGDGKIMLDNKQDIKIQQSLKSMQRRYKGQLNIQ